MLLKLPFHDARKHSRRTTAAQTNTHSRFDSPIALFIPALSSGSALRSPCISVSPLPNSLQTFTHSQLLLCCSLSLISQGSAPGCLQLLLAAYFARGLFPHVSSRLLRFSPAPSTSLQGGVAPTSPPTTLPSFSPRFSCLLSLFIRSPFQISLSENGGEVVGGVAMFIGFERSEWWRDPRSRVVWSDPCC